MPSSSVSGCCFASAVAYLLWKCWSGASTACGWAWACWRKRWSQCASPADLCWGWREQRRSSRWTHPHHWPPGEQERLRGNDRNRRREVGREGKMERYLYWGTFFLFSHTDKISYHYEKCYTYRKEQCAVCDDWSFTWLMWTEGMAAAGTEEWLGELGRDLHGPIESCCFFLMATTFWATGEERHRNTLFINPVKWLLINIFFIQRNSEKFGRLNKNKETRFKHVPQ